METLRQLLLPPPKDPMISLIHLLESIHHEPVMEFIYHEYTIGMDKEEDEENLLPYDFIGTHSFVRKKRVLIPRGDFSRNTVEMMKSDYQRSLKKMVTRKMFEPGFDHTDDDQRLLVAKLMKLDTTLPDIVMVCQELKAFPDTRPTPVFTFYVGKHCSPSETYRAIQTMFVSS